MVVEKEYITYLENHIHNVKNSFEWMKLVIFPMFDEITEDIIKMAELLVNYHDTSKYTKEEFDAYNRYFYGDGKNEKEFNYAWLHHIHNNPHHWEYWVIYRGDDLPIILDMPIQYIIEMICDWWAFSWGKGDLFEIFRWYDENKECIVLSDRTKEIVEKILFEMKLQLSYYPDMSYNQ